ARDRPRARGPPGLAPRPPSRRAALAGGGPDGWPGGRPRARRRRRAGARPVGPRLAARAVAGDDRPQRPLVDGAWTTRSGSHAKTQNPGINGVGGLRPVPVSWALPEGAEGSELWRRGCLHLWRRTEATVPSGVPLPPAVSASGGCNPRPRPRSGSPRGGPGLLARPAPCPVGRHVR